LYRRRIASGRCGLGLVSARHLSQSSTDGSPDREFTQVAPQAGPMRGPRPLRLPLFTEHPESAVTPHEPSIAPAAPANSKALQCPVIGELGVEYLHGAPVQEHPTPSALISPTLRTSKCKVGPWLLAGMRKILQVPNHLARLGCYRCRRVNRRLGPRC